MTTTPTTEGTWQRRFGDSIMKSLSTPKVMLERGDGCYVWDVDGKKYLDFLAGIAVNALGHAHPVLVEALSTQAATLIHVSNYFATPSQVELAERLKRITGAGSRGRVYYGNSGAEANEAAFKLLRLNRGAHGEKTRILALQSAFHGRTMGSLALTGKPALREAFEPMVAGVEHIETSVEALEHAFDDHVAGIIIEPIKGEAGVLDLPEGFLEKARELATKHGALLVLDEIQTGVGRLGSWFAFQQLGVQPDAITLAKGIAGGVPLGALVTFGDASDLFEAGQHGSTFGGNPFATTAANAVLGEIEASGLIENAARRGDEIRAALAGMGSSHIVEVRGRGLLIGVGLDEPIAAEISAKALDAGLIINAPNDSSLRIAPPLIVGDAEIAEFTSTLTSVLKGLE
ncbi:acetylornithine transaminase [Frondihabitans australicus]|uniref:Acetylornithine aminotransferase n=1 Tax=Frondihabitans australicus TaxID=386892 RepID=A0A495IEP6_9MICO|nr:acetylornithine transaminase [Frondihabitans australicus]RKR74462.1 acetylornithine aminotransferase [Frondihabitans australicus]